MTKKDKIKDLWMTAKLKYHLTEGQIKKAKELGMNPKKFGKLTPNKSEPWKEPLGIYIDKYYDKRFS